MRTNFKRSSAALLLLAGTLLSGATVEVQNAIMGRGTMGFGVLAEYGKEGPGKVTLVRKTKANANTLKPSIWSRFGNLCSFRIYDPDGNLVRYVELGNQSEAVKKYEITLPAGKPGIWRFSQSGGLTSDVFELTFPENGVWGIRGEKTVRILRAPQTTFHLFVPETSDTLVTSVWNATVPLKGKVLQSGRIIAPIPAGTKTIPVTLNLKNPRYGCTVCFDGVPGLLAPTPEAALKLQGGLVKVGKRYVEGPLQARAWREIQKFEKKDFDLPPEILNKKIYLGPLAAQNLDKNDLNYGRNDSKRKKADLANYCDNYYRPGVWAEMAASAGPEWQKNMVNRAVLCGFETIVNMDASGIIRSGNIMHGGRLDIATMFETIFGFARGYYFLKPYLTPEQDRIYREATLQAVDKIAGCISYESNQWSHIIAAANYMLMATDEPRMKRQLEIQLHAFLTNALHSKHGQHPDGYFIEEFGPDGNYDNMSGYPMACIYYTWGRRKDADPAIREMLRKGLERDMLFKLLFLIRDPATGNVIALPYANNHRTWGRLVGDGYPSIYLCSREFDAAFTLRNPDPEKPARTAPAHHSWAEAAQRIAAVPEQKAKRITPLAEKPSGDIVLPGHFAWKHDKFYGVTFYTVYPEGNDGIAGPLLLYHEKAGLFVASLKNKINAYLKANGPQDVTWSAITGTKDGKFFCTGNMSRKTLTRSADGKLFRVDAVSQDRKRKETGESYAWEYDLRNAGKVVLNVTSRMPSVRDQVLSIPFWRTYRGKNRYKLQDGCMTFLSQSGKVRVTFPGKGTVLPRVNKQDVFVLRIPMPSSGKISVTFTAE